MEHNKVKAKVILKWELHLFFPQIIEMFLLFNFFCFYVSLPFLLMFYPFLHKLLEISNI